MFESISSRYRDTLFVPATTDVLDIRRYEKTWYLARVRQGGAYHVEDEDVVMPRPWKAVRVDVARYTFFQGVLGKDRFGVETLDTLFTVPQEAIEVGPKMEETEVREWLRDFDRVREQLKAEQVRVAV
jgi:hypothetical protein